MPLLNYQNVGVSITPPNGSATQLQANNASISFSVPIEPIRSLGQSQAIDSISNGPAEGTLSIDYVIINNDPGHGIFTTYVNSTSPNNVGGTSVTIGGRTFSNAYLNSYSLSAEPNSIINASLSFTVYESSNVANLINSQNSSLNNPQIAHGSNSNITNVADAIGFEYNASITWEPVYVLNSFDASLINYGGAQETMTVRGHNLGKAVSPCASTENATVNIKAICDGASINVITIQDAKIQDSELSVQAGGFVEGSYTLVKNY